MVALELDGQRVVASCQSIDPEGLEIFLPIYLVEGRRLTIFLRDTSGGATLSFQGRLASVDQVSSDLYHLRILYQKLKPGVLDQIHEMGLRRGLCDDWSEGDGLILKVRQGQDLEVISLKLEGADRQRAVDQLLAGLFLLQIRPVPRLNQDVILRLVATPPLLLFCRVIKIFEGQGVALSLETPEFMEPALRSYCRGG